MSSKSSPRHDTDKPAARKGAPPSPLPPSIVAAVPTAAQIAQLVNQIAKLRPAFEKELERAAKKGAVPMARAFVGFHRLNDVIEQALKPYAATYDLYKKEKIPALFEQAGVPNVSLDEGFRVGVGSKLYASIKGDKEDPDNALRMRYQAYDWLLQNGLGDIITTTVNSQTLSASIKELIEDKNVEPPSELFNVAHVPNTSVTRT